MVSWRTPKASNQGQLCPRFTGGHIAGAATNTVIRLPRKTAASGDADFSRRINMVSQAYETPLASAATTPQIPANESPSQKKRAIPPQAKTIRIQSDRLTRSRRSHGLNRAI